MRFLAPETFSLFSVFVSFYKSSIGSKFVLTSFTKAELPIAVYLYIYRYFISTRRRYLRRFKPISWYLRTYTYHETAERWQFVSFSNPLPPSEYRSHWHTIGVQLSFNPNLNPYRLITSGF